MIDYTSYRYVPFNSDFSISLMRRKQAKPDGYIYKEQECILHIDTFIILIIAEFEMNVGVIFPFINNLNVQHQNPSDVCNE